mmetsp:Transcript_26634/g.57086  ORF Transcript_26634/g.57086 Transcript_26634/m.57086 type:complete len:177 (+) Transcript_26634:412-942(+)
MLDFNRTSDCIVPALVRKKAKVSTVLLDPGLVMSQQQTICINNTTSSPPTTEPSPVSQSFRWTRPLFERTIDRSSRASLQVQNCDTVYSTNQNYQEQSRPDRRIGLEANPSPSNAIAPRCIHSVSDFAMVSTPLVLPTGPQDKPRRKSYLVVVRARSHPRLEWTMNYQETKDRFTD